MSNLFLSGVGCGRNEFSQKTDELITHRLLSLHGAYLNYARKWVREIAETRDIREIELMFDSGAFTAWVKKEPDIKVDKLLSIYANALRNLGTKFKALWFINLDKIPGSPGCPASKDEVRQAIELSDQNYVKLKKELGNLVLPVFHRSESIDRLQEVIELNPNYICISPRTDGAEPVRRAWCQRVHLYIKNTRTHGLATTGGNMMRQVPWHSVDSSSWAQVAGFGSIRLYVDDNIKSISVSEHSPARRYFGQHVDTLGHTERKLVLDQCDQLGLTIDNLRTSHGARQYFNIKSYQTIANSPYRPTPAQQTLLEL